MSVDTEQSIRAQALESLLVERGLLAEEDIDNTIALYNERVGPMNGARMVARAWVDEAFHQRLLADGTQAVVEFGFEGGEVQNKGYFADGLRRQCPSGALHVGRRGCLLFQRCPPRKAGGYRSRGS